MRLQVQANETGRNWEGRVCVYRSLERGYSVLPGMRGKRGCVSPSDLLWDCRREPSYLTGLSWLRSERQAVGLKEYWVDWVSLSLTSFAVRQSNRSQPGLSLY